MIGTSQSARPSKPSPIDEQFSDKSTQEGIIIAAKNLYPDMVSRKNFQRRHRLSIALISPSATVASHQMNSAR